MLNRKHILAAAVAAAAVGLNAQARINAAQAGEAATAHIAGRVVDVDYRQRQNQYEVDVIASDGRRHEIWVDAQSGHVLDSHLDRDDDDDDDRKRGKGKSRQDHDDDHDDDKDDDRDDRDDKDDRDNDRDDND